MSRENEINTFGFGIKRKAFIILQTGFNNPHKDMWQVSFSFNKRKYYFKSFKSSKLFLEINCPHVKSRRKKEDLTNPKLDLVIRNDDLRDIANVVTFDKYPGIGDTSQIVHKASEDDNG